MVVGQRRAAAAEGAGRQRRRQRACWRPVPWLPVGRASRLAGGGAGSGRGHRTRWTAHDSTTRTTSAQRRALSHAAARLDVHPRRGSPALARWTAARVLVDRSRRHERPVCPQPRRGDAARPSRHRERRAALLVARQPHARVLRRRPAQDRGHRRRNAHGADSCGTAARRCLEQGQPDSVRAAPQCRLGDHRRQRRRADPGADAGQGRYSGLSVVSARWPALRGHRAERRESDGRKPAARIARCPGHAPARRRHVERRVCVGLSALSAEHDAAGAALR